MKAPITPDFAGKIRLLVERYQGNQNYTIPWTGGNPKQIPLFYPRFDFTDRQHDMLAVNRHTGFAVDFHIRQVHIQTGARP